MSAVLQAKEDKANIEGGGQWGPRRRFPRILWEYLLSGYFKYL